MDYELNTDDLDMLLLATEHGTTDLINMLRATIPTATDPKNVHEHFRKKSHFLTTQVIGPSVKILAKATRNGWKQASKTDWSSIEAYYAKNMSG